MPWTTAGVLVGDTATAELLHDRLRRRHNAMESPLLITCTGGSGARVTAPEGDPGP